MISSSAHHGVNRWLIFTGIRVVWIIHWDDKVIHGLFENLLPGGILNISTSCSSSILLAFSIILIFVLGSILNTEVCVAIEFLPPWTIVIAKHIRSIIVVDTLLRHDTQCIDQ